jgi:hypothetical protein
MKKTKNKKITIKLQYCMKEVKKLKTNNSNYTLEDSKPSEEDSELIPFLMIHVIKRTEKKISSWSVHQAMENHA